ncbi:sigma factor regulatory protein, FecR/PupR family [Leptospira fainei serovar Hurstbridge str. BUT 6]|uniref:Sigma factor regulatory protein, FecR/PupR family n=1 Tax=Leptospira fainei serovar Hurstbridge str. BUT 6 TaxID=1193011 RepID=S3US85_9LEPT|nr:FecR family protein [Leptospira fainei]EPG73266.1 sigma factor regulatory protein, FecR/PupR family [Leptospira fainei serovar Hurstbridge str. BUT 6]
MKIWNFAVRPFWITLLLIGILLSCSKIRNWISGRNPKSGAVVVFHTGPVQAYREAEQLPLQTGSVLQPLDEIITNSGSIDIQTVEGQIIRVRPFSKLRLDSFQSNESRDVNLALRAGGVLIRTGKLRNNEGFRISAPTAIAAVRGTAFSFEIGEGELPKIKVYEGLVAMTLKLPMSQEITGEAIAQKPSLQKFQQFLSENEVVIAENEEASVKPKFEDLVQLVLTRIESNKGKNEILEIDEKEYVKSYSKNSIEISPQEKAELETLVSVDQEFIDQTLNSENKNESISLTDSIRKDHEKKLNSAFSKIESEAASKNLESEMEIHNFYNVLERVHKTDKTQLNGAIVTQIGDTLILHSPQGVFRLDKKDIDFVEYKNFQISTKKKVQNPR